MSKLVFLTISVIVASIFFFIGVSVTGNMTKDLNSDFSSCAAGVDIDVLKINTAVQACYKESSLYFAIENQGSVSLSGFKVILQADYPVSMTIREGLPAKQTSQHNLNFGTQKLTEVKGLKIIPLIKSTAGLRQCAAAGIEIDIRPC